MILILKLFIQILTAFFSLCVTGSIAWNNDIITSGSRDNAIFQWDHRSSSVPTRKLIGHTQEVCGLKWSPDHQYLASGGNDNKLLVWNLQSPTPVKTYTDHTAAIKAIAWSPHQVCLYFITETFDTCIYIYMYNFSLPMLLL